MIHLDIARDTVSVDLNIKSARGHTSIHMTPWDSQSQYKRWTNLYKPRDRTAKQIDAFRAAERRARAILTSRCISLHRTAGRNRLRWGLPPQGFGLDELVQDSSDNPSMKHPLPPPNPRGAAEQEDRRVAHGAASTWSCENSPSPAFPPPPSYEEDMEGPNVAQSLQSPDGQEHHAPHNYEEEEASPDNDYQPQEQLQYDDVSMDEGEDDLPEDQREPTALPEAPKEAMGLKESPATYVPKSPKYVRDSEDEGAQDLSDDDIEAPYLAPQRNSEQGLATLDVQAAQALLLMKGQESGRLLVDYSSSDSVPELVDSDGEVCSGDIQLKAHKPIEIFHKKSVDPRASPSTTTAAVVRTSPPKFLNASPRKRPVMMYAPETPLTPQKIPQDEVIYIEDDSEDPVPIRQLTHQVDRILMPPPVDTTLVSRKTVPLPATDQQKQRKRGLAFRRKAKPLKLQVHQVAKMHTGPVDHKHVQLMTQLTSAVVPLKKLQISETPQDTNVQMLPTPLEEESTPEAPKMQ